MTQFIAEIKNAFHKVASSIAFYPALIAVGMMCFSFLIISIEFEPWLMEIKSHISYLLVESIEDGRLILGTLVASTISLMVFSFSMVMVVLSQASSNLSPRLLPGLITRKDNQIVLGVYLGTICYCLMLILNIHPDEKLHAIPSVGIFIGLVLGVSCLGLFTYFIHSISQSIQVDHILDRLVRQTKSKIEKERCEGETECPPTNYKNTLKTNNSGYLKWVHNEEIVRLCKAHDLKITMINKIGHFYISNTPYLKISKKIDDELEAKIHQCFIFYPEEHLVDHYSFGFKQISEIAVKALSSGINDPSTAIKAIDMLIMLLVFKCNCNESCVLNDSDGEPRVYLQPTSVADLLHANITQIREYAKNDVLVMEHLLSGLHKIFVISDSETVKAALIDQLIAIRDSCDRYIPNHLDRKIINSQIEIINNSRKGKVIESLFNDKK